MDQQLKIKSYNPDASSYAPRIKNQQWDQYKPLLKHLHDSGYRRADMLSTLHKQGFCPTLGQLNAKMTAWGFKVYGTQSESSDQQSSDMLPEISSNYFDSEMADITEDDLTLSPTLRRSISSITLCDPERSFNTPTSNAYQILDEVILLHSLTMAGSYSHTVTPSDFGFKSNSEELTEHHYQSVILVADFLSGIHCFCQAFDLYHYVFEHLVGGSHPTDGSIVRSLVRCAMSATTDAQCEHILSFLQRAHSCCIEHTITELAGCFSCLIQDLYSRPSFSSHRGLVSNIVRGDLCRSDGNPVQDIPLLVATDERAVEMGYRKEWLKQQLLACDKSCAALTHLSSWCEDTLSFYRLEKTPIQKSTAKRPLGQLSELHAFEHDFQRVICALLIDYLNSPGPNMKKADVECKDCVCPFRWGLSPSTGLIVMAHLLYEPLRLQSDITTNAYLHRRAQNFAASQGTAPLAELQAFASADSATRCDVFVDTFMKHFSTTVSFRRLVSNADSSWDRMAAGKRFAQFLGNTDLSFMPHAGLPGGRRAILKTMVFPFDHDPSFTEGRPSVVSESSGSMGEFQRLARQIDLANAQGGNVTPSDAMSIDTRSSWSFHQVTGFQQGLLSRGNSLSLRREDLDEIEEYRHFIRDNNYGEQNLPPYPDTPKQGYATPKGDNS